MGWQVCIMLHWFYILFLIRVLSVALCGTVTRAHLCCRHCIFDSVHKRCGYLPLLSSCTLWCQSMCAVFFCIFFFLSLFLLWCKTQYLLELSYTFQVTIAFSKNVLSNMKSILTTESKDLFFLDAPLFLYSVLNQSFICGYSWNWLYTTTWCDLSHLQCVHSRFDIGHEMCMLMLPKEQDQRGCG